MKFSKNFSLSEMTKSQTASRLGIKNTPTAASIENLKLLCTEILQPVRDHYGRPITVSSGYRTVKLNTAIGGSSTSHHTRGQAADIEIVGFSNYELALYISQNYKFTQVILEFYTPGIEDSGWVHVSYDPKDLRNQVLTASRVRGKTVYRPGLIK
jgi:zinc D-Ala-D-Ala carboxypeptidase